MTIDQMTDTRVIIKGLKMHRTVLKRVVRRLVQADRAGRRHCPHGWWHGRGEEQVAG